MGKTSVSERDSLIILDPVMKERTQMTFQSYTSVMLWGNLRPYLIIFKTAPSVCVVA